MNGKEHNDKNSITEELLFRHFSRKASVEEEAQIEEWKSKASNQEEYNRIKIFYKDVVAVQSLVWNQKIYKKGKAWKKFVAQENFKEAKPSANWYRLSIAASILILFGLSFFISRYMMTTTESEVIIASETTKRTLQDGSHVTINTGSQLTIPKSFKAEERRVTLTGEAYFQVEKDPKRTFLVQTTDAEVEVLGTSFNVKESLNGIKVSVDEGVVSLKHKYGEMILKAGEYGEVNLKQQKLNKGNLLPTKSHQYWHTKKLQFKALELEKVMQV